MARYWFLSLHIIVALFIISTIPTQASEIKYYGKAHKDHVRISANEQEWMQAPPVDQILHTLFFQDKAAGKYMEIGAADGKADSNTKFFEESMGWNGILVEPLKRQFEALKKNRPNSQAVHAIVCPEHRRVRLYDLGLGSSVVPPKDGASVPVEEYECTSAKMITKALGVNHLDLVVVDVENAELDVLKTFDFKFVKVDVLVMDTSKYCTQGKHNACEQILSKKGFCKAAHSSINNFYVRKEEYKHYCEKPLNTIDILRMIEQQGPLALPASAASSVDTNAAVPAEKIYFDALETKVGNGVKVAQEPESHVSLKTNIRVLDSPQLSAAAPAKRTIIEKSSSSSSTSIDVTTSSNEAAEESEPIRASVATEAVAAAPESSESKPARTLIQRKPSFDLERHFQEMRHMLESLFASKEQEFTEQIEALLEKDKQQQQLIEKQRQLLEQASQGQDSEKLRLMVHDLEKANRVRASEVNKLETHLKEMTSKISESHEIIEELQELNTAYKQRIDMNEETRTANEKRQAELEARLSELSQAMHDSKQEFNMEGWLSNAKVSMSTVLRKMEEVAPHLEQLDTMEETLRESIAELDLMEPDVVRVTAKILTMTTLISVSMILVACLYYTSKKMAWQMICMVSVTNTWFALLLFLSKFVFKHDIFDDLFANHRNVLYMVHLSFACQVFCMALALRQFWHEQVKDEFMIDDGSLFGSGATAGARKITSIVAGSYFIFAVVYLFSFAFPCIKLNMFGESLCVMSIAGVLLLLKAQIVMLVAVFYLSRLEESDDKATTIDSNFFDVEAGVAPVHGGRQAVFF